MKIRFQANSIADIWPVLQHACQKLESTQIGNYKITYTERLPLKELDSAIDKHFECRTQLKKLRKQQDESTIQFRMIQKRLLNRFKDKNPSPLNNLDFLLTHTYGIIIDVANQIDLYKEKLALTASELASTIEIALLLTSFGTSEKMTKEQYEMLKLCIQPQVDDGNLLSEMGWEEVCYASTAHLLRTCLSKKPQP